MRKRTHLLAAGVAFAFLVAIATTGAAADKNLSVQVREVAVKASPNYLSGTVGTLSLGNAVEVTSEDGNWYRISRPAGYIPKNTVSTAKVSVDTGKGYAAGSASHDEVALAGKGFNPQVEKQYKRNNASMAAAYTQVDRVEAIKVPVAELQSFIAAGKLNR